MRPRWGRTALGAVLLASILLPAVLYVRSSHQAAPEPLDLDARIALRPAEAALALGISERTFRDLLPRLPHVKVKGAVLIPLAGLRRWLEEETFPEPGASPEPPAHLPQIGDDFVGEDLASLPPTPIDGGDLPAPVEKSTEWDAPAATELLAIETSTVGDGSPAHLPQIGDDFVGEDLASLPPTPIDGGDLPAPVEKSTEWDAPAATELLAIETSTVGDGSLIELRANGSISVFEVFTLDDPDRLVIDLPGMVSTVWPLPLKVDSTRVAQIRVGRHDAMVRVVLDSEDGAESFESRVLEPAPDGLRITLGPLAEVSRAPPEEQAEPQPVASIAPPDEAAPIAPGLTQPARKRGELPRYLVPSDAAEGSSASAPAREESYDCIIEPFELVEVGSALTAVVASVDVERSDFVEAGQVLARLEASPERATVAVARARAQMDGILLARRARMELGWRKQERAEQLFEQDVLSANLRDEISTDAEVAKAVVQEAREEKELMELQYQEAIERLEEHTIHSPISGVVVDRLKSRGEVVKEETIVVLAQIDPLRVEVILPAAYFGSVLPGMRAEVTPELPNAGVRVASVTVVDPVVDGTSGTFGVRLELPNADYAVPSGLRCRVRFLQID